MCITTGPKFISLYLNTKTKKKKTFGYYSSSSPIHSSPFLFRVMVIFPAPWERPTTDLYLDNVERDDTSDFSHYANHRSAQKLQPKWNFPIKFHSFKFGTWIEWRWQMDDKCRIRLQRSSGCERVTDLSAIHFFLLDSQVCPLSCLFRYWFMPNALLFHYSLAHLPAPLRCSPISFTCSHSRNVLIVSH